MSQRVEHSTITALRLAGVPVDYLRWIITRLMTARSPADKRRC